MRYVEQTGRFFVRNLAPNAVREVVIRKEDVGGKLNRTRQTGNNGADHSTVNQTRQQV